MLILLPHSKHGLPELLEKIYDARKFAHFYEVFKRSNYSNDRVELSLPRFKLGSGESMDLKKTLSNMGLEAIFDPHRAEFARISEKEKVHISAVMHQAMIEVS